MNNERELLELAAKAAGLPVEFGEGGVNGYWPLGYTDDGDVAAWWNPAHDSADGAELEAALGLDVEWCDGAVLVGDHAPVWVIEYFKDHGDNAQNARMWATLRAAAEIQRRK